MDDLQATIVELLRKRVKPGMAGVDLDSGAADSIENLCKLVDALRAEIADLERQLDTARSLIGVHC